MHELYTAGNSLVKGYCEHLKTQGAEKIMILA